MAEQVAEPPVKPRRSPRIRVVPERQEEGCHYCSGCGRLLVSEAEFCRECRGDIRGAFVDRVRVLQAQGAKVPEIADRLGVGEGEVRGALAKAARMRRHRQRVMRAR
jgi:hypothetical protein